MLVDTDIIIWFIKGNEKAKQLLNGNIGFSISAVTYMELVQGMRNKKELNILRQALKFWQVRILHISEEISNKAMFYVEHHFLSNSMQLADALIGATAIEYGLLLLTGNTKHYKVIKEVELKKFTP